MSGPYNHDRVVCSKPPDRVITPHPEAATVRSMAAHWEYKVLELAPEPGALAQLLSDECGEGWELVTSVELGADDVARSQLVFRREPVNPTWDEPRD